MVRKGKERTKKMCTIANVELSCHISNEKGLKRFVPKPTTCKHSSVDCAAKRIQISMMYYKRPIVTSTPRKGKHRATDMEREGVQQGKTTETRRF
jgi:hypothetical protein